METVHEIIQAYFFDALMVLLPFKLKLVRASKVSVGCSVVAVRCSVLNQNTGYLKN